MAISTLGADPTAIAIGDKPVSLSPVSKRRRVARESAVILAVWTLIALASASYTSVSRLYADQDAEWTRYLVLNLIDHTIMAGFTGVFLALVRRWPLGAGQWRFTPMYLAVIAVLVFVKYLTYLPIRQFFYPGLPLSHSMLEILFYEYFQMMAVVGVVHAIEYGRSLRETRLRASQLESHLSNARLEVLRSELQPHFLFNALHAISTLMHRDVEAADEMVTHLGDLLRRSLETRSVQEVPLREELSVLEPYLNIVRIRFGDRLTISVDVDPALLDVCVPLFILQPLVENAIHHGIARRAGAGRIVIRARGGAESVQMTVSDDGAGIACDAIPEGVGLSNTRLRLEQLYGARGRLVLKGYPGSGAEAIVTIPRARGEAERVR
jgi:two-component system, LytTR family, sensor kinase